MLELHRTKGLNPRMTVCEWCGKDVGIALLGARDFVTDCPTCKLRLIGGGPCPKCRTSGTNRRPIGEHEKLPCGLCDECAERNRAAEAEVARGGIHWRHAKCGSTGAIRAEAEISKAVRLKSGIASGPVGIEMEDGNCPVCNERGERP